MRQRITAALAVAALLAGTVTACTPEPIENLPSASRGLGEISMTVGTPVVPDGVDPQEGAVLARVYAAALKAAGVDVTVNDRTTQTPGASAQLANGSADVVPVYSLVTLQELDPAGGSVDAAEVMASLAKALPAGQKLLDASKAEDRDGVVVTAVTAQKYQLQTLADLGKVCTQLAMAGTAQFKTKGHGLSGLGSDYNCVPRKYEALAPTVDYGPDSILWALLRDDVQIADIHSSSPVIEDNALVLLGDPKELFKAQNIVPLVTTDKVPDAVQNVLNKVSAVLTTEELGNLNRLARGRELDQLFDVANTWLVQKGLVKASS